jgi:hypothetical protein
MSWCLVGSEMCIRDRARRQNDGPKNHGESQLVLV